MAINKNTTFELFIKLSIILGVYFPISSSLNAEELTVDSNNKEEVADFYRNYFCTPKNEKSGWIGDIEAGIEGDTTEGFKQASLTTINFFRALAGIKADIIFKDELNKKAAKAALMMSANGMLSHTPPETWKHYSIDGAEAARNSNLATAAGPRAINLYMDDSGIPHVGHRSWILCPFIEQMGIGDVIPDSESDFFSANALYTIGKFRNSPYMGIAWPPEGYVPKDIIFNDWSFEYPTADFSNTTVSVTKDGQNIPVTVLSRGGFYCASGIVWSLETPSETSKELEATYRVNISNVIIDGEAQSFSYDVKKFDANPPLEEHSLATVSQLNDKNNPETGGYSLGVRVVHESGCTSDLSDINLTAFYRKNDQQEWEVLQTGLKIYEHIPAFLDGQYQFRAEGLDIVSDIWDGTTLSNREDNPTQNEEPNPKPTLEPETENDSNRDAESTPIPVEPSPTPTPTKTPDNLEPAINPTITPSPTPNLDQVEDENLLPDIPVVKDPLKEDNDESERNSTSNEGEITLVEAHDLIKNTLKSISKKRASKKEVDFDSVLLNLEKIKAITDLNKEKKIKRNLKLAQRKVKKAKRLNKNIKKLKKLISQTRKHISRVIKDLKKLL